MCTQIKDQLREQLKIFKDCHNQLLKKLAKEQEKNKNLEVRLKLLSDFTEDFTQQINRSIMAENQILIIELNSIKKLLNDLYEEIDKNYTESLERNDKLSMNCAKSELDLITKILKEVEKI